MEQQDKAINNIRLQTNILNKAQLILLFNLYDNRFIHEKFLDQIFENLIENKRMIQYDFQEKIFNGLSYEKNLEILDKKVDTNDISKKGLQKNLSDYIKVYKPAKKVKKNS